MSVGNIPYLQPVHQYRKRAAELLGTSDLVFYEDDFVDGFAGGRWTASPAGAGSVSAKDEACGVARLLSDNTNTQLLLSGNSTSRPVIIPGGSAGEWYWGIRFKAIGGVGVNVSNFAAMMYQSLAGNKLEQGFLHARNAANFIAFGENGGTLNSGLAVDANYHVHELVRRAGTTTYYIDGVIRGSGNLYPSAACCPYFETRPDGATPREGNCDWILIAVPSSKRP